MADSGKDEKNFPHYMYHRFKVKKDGEIGWEKRNKPFPGSWPGKIKINGVEIEARRLDTGGSQPVYEGEEVEIFEMRVDIPEELEAENQPPAASPNTS